MTREQMMIHMELLDETFIAEASPEHAKKIKGKRVRRAVLRIGSIAACLCLLISVLFFRQSMMSSDTGTTPDIVSSYTIKMSNSYTSPENGKFFCVRDVNAARVHYAGQPVEFLLKVDMFVDRHFLESKEALDAEYRRLSALGYAFYEVEAWTYEGEGDKRYYPVIVGVFTEEQLQNFPAHPGIGYVFSFVDNGDGSSVTFSKSSAISMYQTRYN